jgi:hypothetical protein
MLARWCRLPPCGTTIGAQESSKHHLAHIGAINRHRVGKALDREDAVASDDGLLLVLSARRGRQPLALPQEVERLPLSEQRLTSAAIALLHRPVIFLSDGRVAQHLGLGKLRQPAPTGPATRMENSDNVPKGYSGVRCYGSDRAEMKTFIANLAVKPGDAMRRRRSRSVRLGRRSAA